MLSSCAGLLDNDLSTRRLAGDGRRLYESWFWKGGEERYVECGVLDRSDAGGECVTGRGIEDVAEEVRIEGMRGCRH
jgi:hypothetical protein